jgi:uncharacterized protein (TIGR02452 family)
MEPIFADTLSLISTIKHDPSVFFKGLLKSRQPPILKGKSKYHVVNEDCVDACVRIVQSSDSDNKCRDCRVGLLNMASDICPGGGSKRGSKAQEEDICRRTTLYPTLLQQHPRYPLAHDNIIYSPNVKVVKDGAYSRYHPASFTNIAGIVSAAAIRRPTLSEFGELSQGDYDLLKNKIRMVLEVFEYAKMDHIVLGAWGCGAFCNPPRQVAAAFYEILQDFYFENVTFAIIYPWARDKANFDVFSSVFKGT